MSTATKGRAAEHFVRDRYLAEGWRVIRAASSKGVADLVATRPGSKSLHYISVKCNSWPPAAERTDLKALAVECGMGGPPDRPPSPGKWAVVVYRKDDRYGWRVRHIGADFEITRLAWGHPDVEFTIKSLDAE